jgi:hypothetical protein
VSQGGECHREVGGGAVHRCVGSESCAEELHIEESDGGVPDGEAHVSHSAPHSGQVRVSALGEPHEEGVGGGVVAPLLLGVEELRVALQILGLGAQGGGCGGGVASKK